MPGNFNKLVADRMQSTGESWQTASQRVLARRVASRFLATVGMEHPSEDSKKEYLKQHPNADPSKHTVKKHEDDDVTKMMKEHEKKNPGSINWDYDPKKNKGKPFVDETDEEAEARRKKHGLPAPK